MAIIKSMKWTEVQEAYGTGIWKLILFGKENFWRFLRFKLGAGVDISIWDDLWCGGMPHLRQEFGAIYNLALNKVGTLVVEVVRCLG